MEQRESDEQDQMRSAIHIPLPACYTAGDWLKTVHREVVLGSEGVQCSAMQARREPTVYDLVSRSISDIWPPLRVERINRNEFKPADMRPVGAIRKNGEKYFPHLPSWDAISPDGERKKGFKHAQWMTIHFNSTLDEGAFEMEGIADHGNHSMLDRSAGDTSDGLLFDRVLSRIPSYYGPSYTPISGVEPKWSKCALHSVVDESNVFAEHFAAFKKFRQGFRCGDGISHYHSMHCGFKAKAAPAEETFMAAARGSCFDVTCVEMAFAADVARDPLHSAAWSGIHRSDLCCYVPDYELDHSGHESLMGSALYIPIGPIVDPSQVNALYYTRGRSPVVVRVNLWRRFGGRQVFVEVDTCPWCGHAGPCWPYYRRGCCQLGTLLFGHPARCGIVTYGDAPAYIKDLLLYVSASDITITRNHNAAGYVLGSSSRENVFPLMFDMLDSLQDVLSDLMRILKALVALGVYHIRHFSHETVRGVSARCLIVELGCVGFAFGPSRKETIWWAAVDAFVDWLREQPKATPIVGVLYRAFCAVVMVSSIEFAMFCAGSNRRPVGFPTLSYLCRQVIGVAEVAIEEGAKWPEGLMVDINPHVAALSVRSFLDIIRGEGHYLALEFGYVTLSAESLDRNGHVSNMLEVD